MKMINSSSHTIRVPSELLTADAWKGGEARPLHVIIPPRGIVDIEDAYALRKRVQHGDGPAVVIASAVENVAPQLKPHGPEAQALYESKTVDDLDHVKRAFAELERVGKASSGTADDAVVKAKIEKGIREGVAAVLGLNEPKPEAVPVIVVEEEPQPPATE